MLLYEKLTEEEHVESSVVDYVFELINRMKKMSGIGNPTHGRCQTKTEVVHDEEDIPSLELENERSGWSKIISDVQLNSKLSQIQRGQLKELLYEYIIAAPLTDLLKGRNRKSTVDWNSSCQNAFEELKTRLSKNPVLYSPDFTKPFIIQCDASNLGIGVVLSQVCENEEHPIMFLSKSCRLGRTKYSTTEKECAAIIFAVQKVEMLS
ncbi:retrovirus-related Pol polyprotein from transposon 17.6 [Trichonephila clavipes]|nr:retrovirus-related Pol polyprotein from transposon 17.6 [Trichonephila clavipes]